MFCHISLRLLCRGRLALHLQVAEHRLQSAAAAATLADASWPGAEGDGAAGPGALLDRVQCGDGWRGGGEYLHPPTRIPVVPSASSFFLGLGFRRVLGSSCFRPASPPPETTTAAVLPAQACKVFGKDGNRAYDAELAVLSKVKRNHIEGLPLLLAPDPSLEGETTPNMLVTTPVASPLREWAGFLVLGGSICGSGICESEAE